MIKQLFSGLSVLAALSISFPAFAEETTSPATAVESVSIPVVQPLPEQSSSLRIKRGEVCPPVPAADDPWPAQVVSLVGGCYTTSEQQYQSARKRQLRFMYTPTERERAYQTGYFVSLEGPDVYLKNMQGKYALPKTVAYVHETAAQYRAAGCGRLAVNSGVRAITAQPKNASPFSLHPTGLAVDFAIPSEARCEAWLENYLREQEQLKRIDATREVAPPHFHVVLTIEESSPVQLAHTQAPTLP